MAVIFDLDGTLIDSIDDVSATLNTVLREEGVPGLSSPEVRELMGDGAWALIRKALRCRGIVYADERLGRLRDRFIEIYCRDPVAATRCFPYASETLAHLKSRGVAIGVCSNKAEEPIRLILERLGLARHISGVVGMDSGHGQKPDAAPLLACAVKLGAPSSSVVYIGDSHVDVETARAAKVPIIAVAFGYSVKPAVDLGADRVISCLSEVPAAIRGLI